MEQLSINCIQYIWSAIHNPSQTNHAGFTILNLLKTNAMSNAQRITLDEFAQTKNFSMSEMVVVEIQNLLTGNINLQRQIQDAISKSQNDVIVPMPPINTQAQQQESYQPQQQSGESGMGEVGVGMLWLVGGVALTAISDGAAVFYGAMIYGVIKIISGLAK